MNSDSTVVSLTVNPRGGSVGRKAPRYPQLAEPEQLEVDLASVGEAVRKLHTGLGSLRELREVVPQARELTAIVQSTRLVDRVHQYGEPATTKEVAQHIANLIGSDPRDDIAEPDIYVWNMEQDLGSLRPSRFAIEAGCRKIRRTLRFRPKIAEVYAAVQEAEAALQSMARHLQVLPERLAIAEAKLAQIEDAVRKDNARRATEKARIHEALDEGADWATASQRANGAVAGEVSREIREEAERAPSEVERQRILRVIGEDDETLERWKAERAAEKAAQEAERRRVLDEEFAKTKAKMVLRLEIAARLERGESVDEYNPLDVVTAGFTLRSRGGTE